MDKPKATLLVVDDQDISIEIILGCLKNSNYSIHTARDGEEAWQLLSESPGIYSAVLLDRIMPRLDGLSVLKKMKAHPDLKQIPVIFQTSLTNEDQIIEGIEAGAYYYLKKPVEKKILKAIVKAAVSEYEQYTFLFKRALEIVDAVHFLKTGEFEFRTLAEGYKLAVLGATLCPGSKMVVVGLWELIANAVEHGNLGISYEQKSRLNEHDRFEEEVSRLLTLPENTSKVVTFNVEKTGDEIRFTIQDQGEGFDWESYLDFSPERVFDNHGRGIATANNFCFDRLEFQGCGNRVHAVAKCPPAGLPAGELL